MNSTEIITTIQRSINDNRLCTVKNLHETDRRFLLPLKMSDFYYLSAVEEGVRFDGFLIDKIESVETIIPSGEAADKLLRDSGLLAELKTPQIDLTSPDRIFAYLVSMKVPVYLECVEEGRFDIGFFTGVITDCNESTFDLRCFDVNCNWNPAVMSIPYTDMLRLSFGSDVLKTYEAALPPMPARRKHSLG